MKKYFPVRHFGTTATQLMCHYETLGITRDATPAEVKAAYYKRSMELHPDKVTGNREQFERVTNAYKVLSDDHLRRIHDQRTVARDQYSGPVYRNSSKTQFSSAPPVFDFGAWMHRHYFNQERMEETKNRMEVRKMKKDVAERENVVLGVFVLFLILLGYSLNNSIREETSSFDKRPRIHPTENPCSKENSNSSMKDKI